MRPLTTPTASGAVITFLAVTAALYLGQDVLIPLALALLLSLLLAPVVEAIERLRVPRTVAVALVTLGAAGALAWGGWAVVNQLGSLGRKLPEYKDTLRAKAAALEKPLSRAIGKVQETIAEVSPDGTPDRGKAEPPLRVEVVERPPSALEVVGSVLGSFLEALGTTAVVLVLTVFFLIFHADMRDRLLRLVGDQRINLTTQAMSEAGRGISRYLLSQATLNAAYGTLLGVGLYAFGVPNAVLWGILGGVLRFVPYVGAWLAAAMPLLLSMAVFEGWTRPLLVAAYIVTLDVLIANVVEPVVYGYRTGLSPLAVVLSAVFWAWLWGGTGLILAVPLTVCLYVLGKHLPPLRLFAVLLGREPALEPRARLYHRLLARDGESAAEVLEEERRGKDAAAVFDGLLLPTLAFAEQARHHGDLEDGAAAEIFRDLGELAEGLDDGPPAAEPPRAGGLKVLLMAASDAADETAAELFRRLAARNGLGPELVPLSASSGEKAEAVARARPDAVCVWAVPPSPVNRARYLYKRLRWQYPALPIVIGLWGARGEPQDLESRVAPDGKARVVTSFAEALRALRALEAEARARKPVA